MRRRGLGLGVMCVCMFLLGTGVAHGQLSGQIVAWGWNSNGQCNVPAPNADFVAVAAGWRHSLGLKSDGTIVAWGATGDVPAPNAYFVAVAAGGAHSLGLKSDGTIVAWGATGDVPAPNADFVAVAGGDAHSLGLKSDGTIVAWGATGDVPAPNEDFVAVAGGGGHSLGLKSDGTIVAWGRNNYGQCNVPAPNEDFVAVAGGRWHSLGLKSDGTIVAWGHNNYGQSNVPAPNADFVAVAGGDAHSLGLKSDGTIVAWGSNIYGECNVPAPSADFVAIGVGWVHSLGVKKRSQLGISGVKFNDANGNGTRQSGEEGLPGWTIQLNPGALATLTNDNGEYFFRFLDPGVYTVNEVLKSNWEQTCPPGNTHVVDLTSGLPATDIDFGNSALLDVQDLSVSVGGGRARPGFEKRYGITYQNKGTRATNATVTMHLPPEVTHLDSSPGGVYNAAKDQVKWNLGSLAPGYIGWLWTRVRVPPTVELGTTLTSTATINPTVGDNDISDNTATESQVVTGSFDPNDKEVTPEGWILRTDTLTYQVNFQNVGTDTAFNIVVRDTLDLSLDLTTVESGASLHPCIFQIIDRELSWTFPNIQLPDSNVNEPGSHGFVTFTVQPMPDLPVGTEIENRAGVYFDFNPPVITNTVLNTIIEALPATVDVDPNTLNLKSEGKYATTYIELPEGYDPWDIDVSTVLLNGVLPAVAAPTAVADYDSDGVADRMVKFNRSGVIGLLSGSEGSRWWLEERGGNTAPLRHGEEFEVTVSGELEDGTPFLGTDVIRVINPGGGSDGALVLEVYPSPLNKTATISFELPLKGSVKLCIYDAAGRLVRRLLEGQRAAGRHEVTWDRRTDSGREVSAGVYFVRLQKQGGAIVEKVLVVE